MKQKYIASVVYQVETLVDNVFDLQDDEEIYEEKIRIIWNAITPMMQDLETLTLSSRSTESKDNNE